MGRIKRDGRIENRSNRSRLLFHREPYWTKLEPGRALGYRKTRGGAGTWTARLYCPEGSPAHRYKALGTADDLGEADGVHILSFAQAQAVAREWFEEQLRINALALDGEVLHRGPFTVADAMAAYLENARHRGMKGLKNTECSIKAHILPALGDVEIPMLTKGRIQKWHLALSEAPSRRGGRGTKEKESKEKQAEAPATLTDDQKRARRDTANRILTVLKAGLNYTHKKVRSFPSTPWRDVDPFREVTSCRVRFLSLKEQRELVRACPPTFQALVMAALYTGCRYGELTRLRVRDFDPSNKAVFVELSKAGKPRWVRLKPEAVTWFQEQVEGRRGDELLLVKLKAGTSGNGLPKTDLGWKSHDQKKLMTSTCQAAGIEPLTFHELRHTYATTLILARVHLHIVAKQLGHGDTRMVERYYGHLTPSAVAEVIEELAPDLRLRDQPMIEPLLVSTSA